MLIARVFRFAKVEQKFKLPLDGIHCNYSTAIIPRPPLYSFTHSLPFIHQPTFQNVTKSCGFSSSSFVLEAAVVVEVCLALGLYFYHLKKVPYSHRWRLLICPAVNEKKLGDGMLKLKIENNYKDAILPATHPHSIKVCSILKNVLHTLHRDLGFFEIPRVAYHGFADIDSVIEPNQKGIVRRKISGWRTDISHLKGLNWQVLVVDKPEYEAYTLGAGIIVVYTGFLDCHSDLEIETIIAHEVGHSVARHVAERMEFASTVAFLYRTRLYKFVDLNRRLENIYIREESEADYISLRLMAYAGYDPRVIPQVYEKVDELLRISEDEKLNRFPMKERIRLLTQPHVMEEALTIYRQTTGNQVPRRT